MEQKTSHRPKWRLKLLTAVVSVALIASMVSACALVTVNPSRDNAQVIVTVKKNNVKKSVFNNTMVSTEIYQTASGGSMPTGSQLDTLKQQVLDSVVSNEVLAQKAKDDGVKVDEASARKTGLSTYKAVKKQAAKKYNQILKTYNTTDKAFKQYMQDYSVVTAYADKAQSAFEKTLKKNPDKYFSKSVGTVDGKAVDYPTYYYYYTQAYLTAYMKAQMSGTSMSSSELSKVKDDAMKDLAYDNNVIDYAKKHDIKVSDSAVTKAESTLSTNDKMYFSKDSDLDTFLSNLSTGLTHTQYEKGRKQAAKADATETAIKADLRKDVKVSDSEIQNYYNKHKKKYDESTVSAAHILTTKKALAQTIAKEAKKCKTKADFEALMKKYPKDTKKGIEESTDLGAFKYSDMVSAFSKAAFDAKKNTVVGPVKSSYGYHVIFVYDKHKVKNDSYKKHKSAITKTLKNQKVKDEYAKLKKKFKEDPKVKIDDPIKSATDLYVDSLKKQMNVKVYDKRV